MQTAAEHKHRRDMAVHVRRIQRTIARANAPGKEDRIAAAQAKRDRKNEKRASQAVD